MLKSYLVLLMAIVFETVATSFLKQSEQFNEVLAFGGDGSRVCGGFLLP